MTKIILFVVLIQSSFAHALSAIQEELTYHSYQEAILLGTNPQYLAFTEEEQSLLVDALWDLSEENHPEAMSVLKHIDTHLFTTVEKLRIALLRQQKNVAVSMTAKDQEEILNILKLPEENKKLVNLVAAYQNDLLKAGLEEIISTASRRQEFQNFMRNNTDDEVVNASLVEDLVIRSPRLTGKYENGIKLFMFCRKNRNYPCLMIMENGDGNLKRKQNGELWKHKALASAATGLPSYKRNGHTPAGLFTMDGVMPVPDQQLSYGKFRRVILNFIPRSRGEENIKDLLPPSSHSSKWWKPSVSARNVGRNLFRIHGTGRRNTTPGVPWFPFRKTLGCISQRENKYNNVTYADQKILLKSLLKGMNIKPIYQNETKIKGVLYLIELDGLRKSVSLEDLRIRGIQ